jgi:uncharacterized protein YlzI (FlbEa/FlbD family)
LKILKLHEPVTISGTDNWGEPENRTEYEPVFVNVFHIESMNEVGLTRLRMVSGSTLTVIESVEDIMLAAGQQIHEVSE